MNKENIIVYPKGSRVITFDFLHVNVLVLFNENQIKQFSKNLPEDIAENYLYNINSSLGTMSVITLNNIPYFVISLKDDVALNTIVHESVHAIHEICNYTGIPIELNNSETIAYMTGYLSEKIVKEIQIKNRKRSKSNKQLSI